MYYAAAWEDRDSTRIDSVLAADYQGTSSDLGPSPETLSFVKSDEVRAVHQMKMDVDLTSVVVNFGPSSSWTRDSYPSDPADWAVIYIPSVQIELHSTSGADVVVSASRTTNEFKLKPTVSGADTTWEIVRWEEVHHSP
jgi:hypothetical protein